MTINDRALAQNDSEAHIKKATKLNTKVAHVEAGIRSWDLSMPEEINRMVTDTLPTNVDEGPKFKALLKAISESSKGVPVIFPVHPCTRKIIDDLYLVENAKAVITDSGGITEETTVLGVPCITLRNNTERPETITIGTNELIGTDPTNIKPALDKLFSGQWKKGGIPELWDGGAAERMVEVLASYDFVWNKLYCDCGGIFG